MARQRRHRSSRMLDDLPGLFDSLDLDLSPVSGENGGSTLHELKGKSPATLDGPAPVTEVDAKALETPRATLRYISFGSGSSGNCAYLGDDDGGFLIDAGVDNNRVTKELERNGIDMRKIHGIILTHDHSDHVRFAYSLLRRNPHMLLFCTPRNLNGLLRRHNISRRIKDYHKAIFKEIPFKLGNFTITAFEVDHDGTDNMGFDIAHDDSRHFVIATDMGEIGERADFYIRQSNYLMIESNYDLMMLRNGHYPEYLKARIMSTHGHLDNQVTADYLAKIWTPQLSHIFLCHLSHDNNLPELALEACRKALESLDISVGDGTGVLATREAPVQLLALPRFESSPLMILR